MRPKFEPFHQKNHNVFYTEVIRGGLYGLEKSELRWGATPRKTNYDCTVGKIFRVGTTGTIQLVLKDAKRLVDEWRKGHKYE